MKDKEKERIERIIQQNRAQGRLKGKYHIV